MFKEKSQFNFVRPCRIKVSNKPYIKLDNLYAFFFKVLFINHNLYQNFTIKKYNQTNDIWLSFPRNENFVEVQIIPEK